MGAERVSALPVFPFPCLPLPLWRHVSRETMRDHVIIGLLTLPFHGSTHRYAA
jgi:hypothetical protein